MSRLSLLAQLLSLAFAMATMPSVAQSTISKVGDPPLKLDDLPLDFDTESYFARDRALLAKYLREQEDHNYYEDRAWYDDYESYYPITVDTLQTPDEHERFLAVSYTMSAYNVADTVACLAGLPLHSIGMLTDGTGAFRAAGGVHAGRDSSGFRELVLSLTDMHGVPRKSTGAFMDTFVVYTWKVGDRLLKVVPRANDNTNVFTIVEVPAAHTDTDIEISAPGPTVDTYVFIVAAAAAEELVGRMPQGQWLYMD